MDHNALQHSALASPVRRHILEVLGAAPTLDSGHPPDSGHAHQPAQPLAMAASAIAEAVGIHVTTTRFHLDQLETADLVRRVSARDQNASEQATPHESPLPAVPPPGATVPPPPPPTPPKRRGRPQVLYSLVHTTVQPGAEANAHPGGTMGESDVTDNAREQLIEVLAATLSATLSASPPAGDQALAATPHETVAVSAGHNWAQHLATGAVNGETPELLSVLSELGFDPHLLPAPPASDATIELRACPFRAAARQHPEIICEVHRGLVDELLTPEQRARGVRLLPFVGPNLCAIGVPPN